MKWKLLGVLFTILGFAACQQELLVVLDPPGENELAIYAFINCEDSLSTASVGRSFVFQEGYNPNNTQLNTPATVRLSSQEGEEALFQPVGNSPTYQAPHRPVGEMPGPLRLSATHPQYGSLEAEASPPARGRIVTARLLDEYTTRSGRRLSNVLEVVLQDSLGPANYYELGLSVLSGTAVVQVPFSALEEIVVDGQAAAFPAVIFGGRALIADAGFDGAAFRLAFTLSTMPEPASSARLIVRHCSQDYFEYVNYLEVATRSEDIFQSPAFQPPYSNFSGEGIGLFALYFETSILVEQ